MEDKHEQTRRFTTTNELIVDGYTDKFASSELIYAHETQDVAFCIMAAIEYRSKFYQLVARLIMVDSTTIGSKWTVSWTGQIVEQSGQIVKTLNGPEVKYEYKGGVHIVDTNVLPMDIGDAQKFIIKSTILAIENELGTHKPKRIQYSQETQMLKDLAIMYDDGQLLDCTIAVPKANREFKASQFLLSTRSPVFRQMFVADMAEAKSKRISIEDFDADVVSQLVRYIHTDSIDETLEVTARELLLIADKYDVRGLKDIAQNLLSKSLTVETVCDTFEFATLIADAKALREVCVGFIRANRLVVKSRGNWQNLNNEAKAQLLDVFF